LTAAPSSVTAPTTLMIQTPHRGVVTVQVSATTQIVRRFGAASGLDELSVNDVLEVRGALVGPNTVAATHIRDFSIQGAFTHLIGLVLAVTPNSVSVVVQQDKRARAPFAVGEHLTLPVGSSTAVISGTTVTMGSTSAITMGMRVASLGIFNRVSHSFISTFRIRILS